MLFDHTSVNSLMKKHYKIGENLDFWFALVNLKKKKPTNIVTFKKLTNICTY